MTSSLFRPSLFNATQWIALNILGRKGERVIHGSTKKRR